MRFAFGDYELDEECFELRRGGARVPVEPKVLRVLLNLVKNRSRVVLKQELFDAEWAGVKVSEASLWRVVMLARKAIGDDLQRALVTVRGRGFRFVAHVEERASAANAGRVTAEIDPTFIGRAACMTALEGRLDDALARRGNMACLTGEAGIGKTRTADELGRRAAAREARVIVVRAHEAVAARPLWLWSQVARALTADRADPATARFLERAAPLVAGEAVPEGEELALFDALARLLLDASRVRPIVLLLDDLHWADEPSLRILELLPRQLRGGAVLVVGTFRDTALTGDARARSLGGLLREHATAAIPLRGFGLDDVVRFVEAASGVAPSPALARDLLERSGGNPLYLHQLLRSDWGERALNDVATTLATSMDLEQGIVESIFLHLDNVSRATRELLAVAAVLGREIEVTTLAVVSGLTQADLSGRLDEALRARLLVRSGGHAYRFAHALVRDVLYRKLGSLERATLHRLAGEKLAAHFGETADLHAAELARHYVRSLPGPNAKRAMELAVVAARQDMARGAHRLAIKHWGLAAHALSHVRGERAARIEVQLGLSRAFARAGDETSAREAFLDAATLARTFAEPEALADAALGFGELRTAGDDELGHALLEEALGALDATPGASAERLRGEIEAARGRSRSEPSRP